MAQTAKKKEGYLALRIKNAIIPQTRKDIKSWKTAVAQAQNPTEPRQRLLQELFLEIAGDALLSSQISNRQEQIIGSAFEMADAGGTVDDKATAALRNINAMQDIVKAILDSEFYGFSIGELQNAGGNWQFAVLPRRHFVPQTGLFYPDLGGTGVPYRTMQEYGKWILEFNSSHLGMLNKAATQFLFKKFAMSCWSELCEIYGIPPRYIKTNTQDENMLRRAEDMMKQMGAAAWFIIDSTEDFQFAQGVSTTGDVYNNLIRLCNNEISLLVSGAVIGQDTEHGNESKEEASIKILQRLVESDKRMVEMYMNSAVLPALRSIGAVTVGEGLRFRFSATEDNGQLWKQVVELLPYKEVKNEWITEKFGIPVADKIGFNDSLKALSTQFNSDYSPFV